VLLTQIFSHSRGTGTGIRFWIPFRIENGVKPLIPNILPKFVYYGTGIKLGGMQSSGKNYQYISQKLRDHVFLKVRIQPG
jgi:hypothetical protein